MRTYLIKTNQKTTQIITKKETEKKVNINISFNEKPYFTKAKTRLRQEKSSECTHEEALNLRDKQGLTLLAQH